MAATDRGLLQGAKPRHVVCLAALALVGLGVFAPHLLRRGTFVGDADRLNTFLNMRTFSADSVREMGRIPSWNERMFHGFGTTGLHWMLPEADPFAYFQALFPRESLLYVAGCISCLLFVVAAWAMYALAFETCGAPFPSFVAAALYVLSSFSINRICQVDWAFAVLIAAPLGLLTIRRANLANAAWCFLALLALSALMLVMTFLQEVAYVFGMFGLYGCFRSLKTRTWVPVLVVASATGIASILAFPRLYTVFEEFTCLGRSTSFFTTEPAELLRWFDEGLIGGCFKEAQAIGNGINVHEGVQFHSSFFAALLVVVGTVRTRNCRDILAGLLLLIVLTLVLARTGSFMKVALPFLGVFVLMGLWRSIVVDGKATDGDLAFHLLLLAGALAVILLPEARWVLHKAFFSVDFTHSRVTIAALPSLHIPIALFLSELLEKAREAGPRSSGKGFVVAAVAGTALFVPTTVIGERLRWLLDWGEVFRGPPMNVLAGEILTCAAGTVLFAAILAVYSACRNSLGRQLATTTLGFLMLSSAFYAASCLMAGPQTWTFPVPFRGNDYLMAPAGAMRLPTAEEKRALGAKLESAEFRTAVVAYPSRYPAFVEPHLAEFWGIRLTGGYSAGVPKRLGVLPWPGVVHSMRALRMAHEERSPGPCSRC